MNKNEKLYDALTNVDKEFVLEAAAPRAEKRKSYWAWAGAAACLALGLALFFIIKAPKNENDGRTAALPSAEAAEPTEETAAQTPIAGPTDVETPEPSLASTPEASTDLPEKRIIYGEDEEIPVSTRDFPPGTVKILGNLEKDIYDPENEGALFSVTIDVERIGAKQTEAVLQRISEQFDGLFGEADNAAHDGEFAKFLGAFYEWWYQTDYSNDPDELATDYYYSFLDELKKEGDGREPVFRAAVDRLFNANNALLNWVPDELDEEFRRECGRLVGLGLELDLDSIVDTPYYCFLIRGSLTREQIESFPKDEDYVYFIYYSGAVCLIQA